MLRSKVIVDAPFASIAKEDVRCELPSHLLVPILYNVGPFTIVAQKLIQYFISGVLRPRHGVVGDLNQAEVDQVYTREAGRYNWKHHMTTRGQDTIWRRTVGEVILNLFNRGGKHPLKVLDLCTGTGLTVAEIDRVLLSWFGHRTRLSRNIEITGLDFNGNMLAQANKRQGSFQMLSKVFFVQGDATKLAYKANSFDFVSQMFGIGGIKTPVPVFEEALRVLEDGGQFLLIDMHRPIGTLPGESAFFGFFPSMQAFEAMTYERTTIPLALNRLWGWRDTTIDFYQVPFVTYKDEDGSWWGFEVLFRHYEPERWWFSLPVMPTMRILLSKTKISEADALHRQKVLAEVSACA